MAILSTNQKLIKVDVGYSAGNGIDITSGVISVTGDNAPYSAGQNIYFDGDDNHVINGKDWGNDINDASANAFNMASAWVAQNYANSADLTYLSGVVDNKLDASAWSSVSADIATEQYVIANGNVIFGRSTAWVNEQGYLTGVSIPESATWQDVSTTVQTNSAQWAEGGTGDEEVNSFVYNNSATINEVNTSYQTNSGNFYPANNPSSFATEDWVTAQGYITGVDLSEYAKRDFVLSSIESATSGKLDVSSFASVSSDFLTTAFEIPESAAWNDSTYITQTNSSVWSNVTGKQDSLSFHYLEI